MAFVDRNGNVTPVRLEPDGSVPISDDKGSNELLAEILLELRRLRLGMMLANDSVCVDVEAELTPCDEE